MAIQFGNDLKPVQQKLSPSREWWNKLTTESQFDPIAFEVGAEREPGQSEDDWINSQYAKYQANPKGFMEQWTKFIDEDGRTAANKEYQSGGKRSHQAREFLINHMPNSIIDRKQGK